PPSGDVGYDSIHASCKVCHLAGYPKEDPEGWIPSDDPRCHPACSASLASHQRDELVVAALDGNMEEVIRLAVSYPEVATINWDRHAIQVRSCVDGLVVANIPVDATELAAGVQRYAV